MPKWKLKASTTITGQVNCADDKASRKAARETVREAKHETMHETVGRSGGTDGSRLIARPARNRSSQYKPAELSMELRDRRNHRLFVPPAIYGQPGDVQRDADGYYPDSYRLEPPTAQE